MSRSASTGWIDPGRRVVIDGIVDPPELARPPVGRKNRTMLPASVDGPAEAIVAPSIGDGESRARSKTRRRPSNIDIVRLQKLE